MNYESRGSRNGREVGGTTIAEMAREPSMVNVDVVQGAVTLRGTVETADQKADAERIAKNTDGVKSVANQLKIAAKAKT